MQDHIVLKLAEYAKDNQAYAAFNRRIVNTKRPVIGVRVPDVRRLARQLAPDMNAAKISQLLRAKNPSFEYLLLCGLLITRAQLDDHAVIDLTKHYLSQVDSWAQIDTFVEKKRRFASDIWWQFAQECLRDDAEFVVRYGVICLMTNFLDEAHIDRVFAALRTVSHDGYYVKMAMAWLYATAAVNFFQATLDELDCGQINGWTRRKAYQKMRESRRFTPEQQTVIAQRKVVY